MLAVGNIGPSVLPDLPDADDKLDFAPYANTLRDIILNPLTQTPLTIGIFGSWGSGKTSLMKMIENRLKSAVRDGTSERETYTIWFNAWLYSREDSLWRALIMQVLNGMRKWHRSDQTALQELNELAEHLQRAAGPEELGHLSIAAANLLKEEGTDSAELTLTLQHGLDLLENIAEARERGELEAAMALRDQVRRATATLEQERIESLDRFQQEFRGLIEKYVLPHGYMVIFVDDLDRCLPDKAVEVLEAIKLFLDVPGCIFILGIDREVVERGIRLRYGELGGAGDGGRWPLLVSDEVVKEGSQAAARYRSFLQDLSAEDEDTIDGGRYLEKIIQIPFVLPPISPDAMGNFIAQLAPGLPSRECGLVFAQGLEPNPRQVKRAINIFTLLWELSRNKEELAPLIRPVRLAKLVVIQQRHAELYDLLREDPEQLVAWEAFFRRKKDPAGFAGWERGQGGQPSPEVPLHQKVDAYELKSALEALLTMHPLTGETTADANFVDLTADQVRTYVFLTRTVKEAVPEPEAPPVMAEARVVEPAVSEGRGVSVDSGAAGSKRGFITGMIYSDLDPLLEQVAGEGRFPPELRQRALLSLAMAGSSIYAEVASDPNRQAELEAALGEPTLIQVSGIQSEAQIPWEIVYDRPLPYTSMQKVSVMQKMAVPEEDTEVDVEGFWGFKHVIERPLTSGYERPAPPLEIQVGERPLVTLALEASASPPIEDLSGKLPTHPTKTYDTRPLSQIKYLVIHHTALGPDVSVERVARYQVDKLDWPGIGYHYYIASDGTVYQTNPLETVTYHAQDQNPESVGVAFAGNFNDAAPPAVQLENGARLIVYLLQQLSLGVDSVKGLSELVPASQSPGKQWLEGRKWKDMLLFQVEILLSADRVYALFREWASEGRIDLEVVDTPSDLRAILVKRPADVYVLHGRGGVEGGEIWIGLGRERLTRRALESWKAGQRGNALFFLHVMAGLGRGQDWWAWLEAFRDLGAGGVVVPVVTPHLAWSLDFMTQFMQDFLSGQPVGEALREARRELFNETGNPLGLFYAHFGPAEQRLSLPDGDEDEE